MFRLSGTGIEFVDPCTSQPVLKVGVPCYGDRMVHFLSPFLKYTAAGRLLSRAAILN